MAASQDQIDKDLLREAAAACACFNFRKASRAVTQLFDETLQPTGLRSTQLVILMAVALADSASIAELARELVMERSTLTRNLKPLEKRGLIRSASGSDRRTRVVDLTSRGRQAIVDAVPYWHRAQSGFVDRLGQDRWQQMQESLADAVAATRNHSPK